MTLMAKGLTAEMATSASTGGRRGGDAGAIGRGCWSDTCIWVSLAAGAGAATGSAEPGRFFVDSR